jgi:hypothetical protein
MLTLRRSPFRVRAETRDVRDAQLLGDENDRSGWHVGRIRQEPPEHPHRAHCTAKPSRL